MEAATLAPLVSIPFLEKGRDRKEGLDCYGLVREALRDLGLLSLPEDELRSREIVAECAEVLPLETRTRLGDVLLLIYPDEDEPHLSVAIDPFSAMHASSSAGRVITSSIAALKQKAISGALYRPKGGVDGR